jgi:hypothetical protein
MLTVGYIGLGIMAKSIARNIMKAGFPVIVHNRSRTALDREALDTHLFMAFLDKRWVSTHSIHTFHTFLEGAMLRNTGHPFICSFGIGDGCPHISWETWGKHWTPIYL